jgi:hypothetical protein
MNIGGRRIMASKYDYLKEFDTRIKLIEGAAKELISLSEEQDIPAINRNAKRILASVKLLKIQISDILDFGI